MVLILILILFRRKNNHPVERDSTDMEVLMDESRKPEPNNVDNSESRMDLKSENGAVVKTSEHREDIEQVLTDRDHCSNKDCNKSISSSTASSTRPSCIQSVHGKVKGALSGLNDVRFIAFALAIFFFSLHQWNIFLPPSFSSCWNDGLRDSVDSIGLFHK